MGLAVKPQNHLGVHTALPSRPIAGPRFMPPANQAGPVEPSYPISDSMHEENSYRSIALHEDGGFSGNAYDTLYNKQNKGRRELPNPHTGILQISTQGFAELFEVKNSSSHEYSGSYANNNAKALGHRLDHASALYETSMGMGDNTSFVRGETVSMIL